MLSREEVDGYIAKLGDGSVEYNEIEEGLWLVSRDDSETKVVITYSPPIVVMRVNVMELPSDGGAQATLMRKVLQFNTELVHGAYGLEGEHIVLTSAHQLENLDFNEFQASFDDIVLALGSHVPALAEHGEA
jgi:hypothetical protein